MFGRDPFFSSVFGNDPLFQQVESMMGGHLFGAPPQQQVCPWYPDSSLDLDIPRCRANKADG